MKPPGAYKLTHRQHSGVLPRAPLPGNEGARARVELLLERVAYADDRLQRILDSLRREIVEGGEDLDLRIRLVFVTPREIYRLELELPELGYQRTTFLDRDALEELLETDAVRELVEAAALGQ